jgi:hypothetical protein
MKRPLIWVMTSALLAATALVVLPQSYERYATSRLSAQLDAQHGKTGWVVCWTAADYQPDQRIHLLRTLYVRLAYPKLQQYTPWKTLQFTHKSTSERYWHYAVCVLSEGKEVTYFWSIRKNQWVIAWDNNMRDLPIDEQHDYSDRLRNVERKEGLNQSVLLSPVS